MLCVKRFLILKVLSIDLEKLFNYQVNPNAPVRLWRHNTARYVTWRKTVPLFTLIEKFLPTTNNYEIQLCLFSSSFLIKIKFPEISKILLFFHFFPSKSRAYCKFLLYEAPLSAGYLRTEKRAFLVLLGEFLLYSGRHWSGLTKTEKTFGNACSFLAPSAKWLFCYL